MVDWYINQKIVCINDNFEGLALKDEITPKKNEVYTIRDIKYGAFHLDEIINKKLRGDRHLTEVYFLSTRFRPVVDKKIDISIFEKLLLNLDEEIPCNGQEFSTLENTGIKQKKEKFLIED